MCRFLAFFAGVSMTLLPIARAQEQPIKLFNGQDLRGWTAHFNDSNVKMEDVFSVRDGVLNCKGSPNGYLQTSDDYTSYVLRLEWRHIKPGNGGVLMRMQPPDKVWPKSIEAQLQHENAGDIWIIDQFPMFTDPTRTKGRNAKKFKASNEKPVGEWNQYEITLDGPNLTMKVNGELQNEATECQVVPGKICLQSEGSEMEFRNIELTPLKNQAPEPQAQPLFNGKDLSGWDYFIPDKNVKMEDVWSVKDGVIHCTGNPTGFIKTRDKFKNFTLRLQWRWPDKGGNSGVLLRNQEPDAIWPKCFEAQLMHENAGDIYLLGGFTAKADPARTENVNVKKMKPSSEKPLGEWNQYEITMSDGKAELIVNDVVQNTAEDCEPIEGTIGLQSEGVPIEFRNIEIVPIAGTQRLPGSSLNKSLLPGLDGWHVTGNGNWTFHDGIIEGHQGKEEKSYTHVVSDRSYRDFKASLKYKALQGNSGFYFRVRQDDEGNMHGFQAEIDEKNDAGGIYESGGRGWVSKPNPDYVSTYFKPGEWNEMTVEAKGPRVVVHVNGTKTAEINEPTVRTEGPVALQIHGGQDVHVMFQDVVITATE